MRNIDCGTTIHKSVHIKSGRILTLEEFASDGVIVYLGGVGDSNSDEENRSLPPSRENSSIRSKNSTENSTKSAKYYLPQPDYTTYQYTSLRLPPMIV